MTGFLDIVAEKLIKTFGKGVSEYTLVLPGKRACWLLKEKISEHITEPCWEPEFTTLSILTSEASGLQQAIDIVLLAKLFNICKRELGTEFFSDDFDSFVSWGEILLNDFSGIDNNMVDAEKLFINISDIEKIDETFKDEEIDLEVKKTLQKNTQPKDAKYHEEFLKIWDKLYHIYTEYKKELLSQKIGYPGMINRKAAEEASPSEKKYIFIGFNTFNKSEHTFIKKTEPAAIYWDSCEFFKDQKVNTALNPDGMAALDQKIGCDIEEIIRSDKTIKRKIEIVKCPSDVMQCKVVMKRLEEMENVGYETAVVLADDSLLPIMLQSIPGNIQDVNITTGLPITDSSAYTFYKVIESIVANQKRGLYKRDDILYILKSPLFKNQWEGDMEIESFVKSMENNLASYLSVENISNENFRSIFCSSEGNDFSIGKYLMDNISYYAELSSSDDITEIAMRIIRGIRSLDVSISRYDISLSNKLYLRMLDRILSRGYTPYETEAMTGLQVTGILETRCQDFKNIFILSANDDTLPKGSQLLSFIPMNFREHFGLPRSGDFQRMSASYFYHLLYRAENICILYNGNTSSNRTGEVSRFVHQIEYLTPDNTEILHTSIVSKLKARQFPCIDFRHSEETQKAILGLTFSATLISTYLRCQRKFALKYIYKLYPSETSSEDFQSSDYGTAVHNTLEEIGKNGYSDKKARELLTNFSSMVLPILERNGYRFMEEKYPHKIGTSDMTRLKKMMEIWIRNVLEYDSSHGEFQTESVEKEYISDIVVRNQKVKTKMVVDRIDIVNNAYRIIDYKSGAKELPDITEIDSVFEPFKKRNNRDPLLQTLLYGINFKGKNWFVAIYSLPRLQNKEFKPSIAITSSEYDKFEKRLITLLEDMSDSDNTKIFASGENSACKYCDYKSLCNLFTKNNREEDSIDIN